MPKNNVVRIEFGRQAVEDLKRSRRAEDARDFFAEPQIATLESYFDKLKQRGVVNRCKVKWSFGQQDCASVIMQGTVAGHSVTLELRKNLDEKYGPKAYQAFINQKHLCDGWDFLPTLLALVRNGSALQRQYSTSTLKAPVIKL